MQVFIWIDRHTTSLAFYYRARLHAVREVVHSEDKKGAFAECALVDSQRVHEAINAVHRDAILHGTIDVTSKVDVWIVNPSRYKMNAPELALRHIMSGAILAQIDLLGRAGFAEVPQRAHVAVAVPAEIYRRRVFEALMASELTVLELDGAHDPSWGMIEALGLGLHFLKRLKAHAATIGIA